MRCDLRPSSRRANAATEDEKVGGEHRGAAGRIDVWARGQFKSLDDIESFIEVDQRDGAQEELAAVVEGPPAEDLSPKPCPKCGALVPVKARNRVRHLMTIAGELRLSRNYHCCKKCQLGFYPQRHRAEAA